MCLIGSIWRSLPLFVHIRYWVRSLTHTHNNPGERLTVDFVPESISIHLDLFPLTLPKIPGALRRVVRSKPCSAFQKQEEKSVTARCWEAILERKTGKRIKENQFHCPTLYIHQIPRDDKDGIHCELGSIKSNMYWIFIGIIKLPILSQFFPTPPHPSTHAHMTTGLASTSWQRLHPHNFM